MLKRNISPNLFYGFILIFCLFACFEQIIDVEHDPAAGDSLEYDAEWIAVLKATNNLINVTQSLWNMPENNGLHAK